MTSFFKSLLIGGSVLTLTACSQADAKQAATPTDEVKPAAAEVKAEPAPDLPKIETTNLGGGVYMMKGRGGNVGVSIGEDGVIMIDDQFDNMSQPLKNAIAALTDQPVRFLINTHYHGDHTGGNEAFGENGASIIAHHNVHKRMSSDTYSPLWDRTTEASDPAARPVLTYSADATFHMNGQTAHAIHVPAAHTDGDSLIYFAGADVLHMGDNYFNGLFPYIDTGAGGTVDGMIAAHNIALEKITDATQIIPGHGPLASKTDLMAARDMLIDVRDKVKVHIKAGDTVDAAIAADPLAGMESFESFINKERMVRTIYLSEGAQ